MAFMLNSGGLRSANAKQNIFVNGRDKQTMLIDDYQLSKTPKNQHI